MKTWFLAFKCSVSAKVRCFVKSPAGPLVENETHAGRQERDAEAASLPSGNTFD